MRVRTRVLVVSAALVLGGPLAGFAQGPRTADAPRPAPRWPDGTVNLGAPPGEIGHWDSGTGQLSEHPVAMDGAFLINPADIDKVAPFKDWSRALVLYRLSTLGKDDPHPYCKPQGGPRQFFTPWGLEIRHDRNGQIFILSGGNARPWREIFLDGRPHPDPDDWNPSYLGHSIGRWDGDTLVVDTVGFNERFWFARRPSGMPHTDALHLIERISRPNFNTLHYEVTIDDPKAYTRPWTAAWDIPWADYQMLEYFCQDNNLDLRHLAGPGER